MSAPANTGAFKFVSAGVEAIQWSYVNAVGHITGKGNLLRTSTGQASNLGRLKGASVFPYTLGNPQIENALSPYGGLEAVVGDTQDQFAFVMELVAQDWDFRRAAEGHFAINQVRAYRRQYPILKGTARNLIYLLLSRHSISMDPDNEEGQPKWEHLELFSCDVYALGSGYAYQAAATWQYLVVPRPQHILPDGRPFKHVDSYPYPGTFDDPIGDVLNDELAMIEWSSDYPMSAVVAVGNNSVYDIPIPYAPISNVRVDASIEHRADSPIFYSLPSLYMLTQQNPHEIRMDVGTDDGDYMIFTYECESLDE